MKFLIMFLGLAAITTLAGCGGSKDIYFLNYDTDKGKEAGMADFIRLTNGELVKGDIKNSKLGLGLLNKKGSVTMADGKVYNAQDIEEFQIDSVFYKRIPGSNKNFYGRKKSGKINLYYRHIIENGTDSRGHFYNYSYDLYWLQKGENQPIQKFTPALLESMVADNPAASSFIDQYKKAPKNKKNYYLDRAIDVYNDK